MAKSSESMWGSDGPFIGLFILTLMTLLVGGFAVFDCEQSDWIRFGAYVSVIWISYGIGHIAGKDSAKGRRQRGNEERRPPAV